MRRTLRRSYAEILSRETSRLDLGQGTALRIVLVFPSEYRIGMANLGFQLIYAALNRIPGVLCHRAFLPSEVDFPTVEQESLRSLEAFEPLNSYDIVAFSLSYENDLPAVIKILLLSKIPIYSALRQPSDPLVIAGGIVATLNPEPLADVLDAVVLGEGEVVCGEIAQITIDQWAKTRNRMETLQLLSRIEGVYIPSFYRMALSSTDTFARIVPVHPDAPLKFVRRVVDPLDEWTGSRIIHTPDMEFPDLHLVEVSRGCTRRCHFCIIPNCYSYYRFRSADSVIREAEYGPKQLRIGLMGAGTADHPHLSGICERLRADGRSFSFSSLHASEIGPAFIDLIRSTGPRTLTIAPEVASEARRRKIGKQLTDEQLFEAVRIAARTEIASLKLYFMIGLPGETFADIESIAKLCSDVSRFIRTEQKNASTSLRLAISVSCFIPKPHTAFERAVMRDEIDYRRRMTLLGTVMRKLRHIRMTIDNPKSAIMQGIIARGDRRLGPILTRIAIGETTWRQIMRSESCLINQFLSKKALRDPLPWDHLRYGLISL